MIFFLPVFPFHTLQYKTSSFYFSFEQSKHFPEIKSMKCQDKLIWQFQLSTDASNLFESSGIKVLKKNHTFEYIYSQSIHLEWMNQNWWSDCSSHFGGLFFVSCPVALRAYYFGSPKWLQCLWQVTFVFRKSIKSSGTKHTHQTKWLNWTRNLGCIVTLPTHTHAHTHTHGCIMCVFPRLNQKKTF